MFRNFAILIALLHILMACKSPKNPDLPENAINTTLIHNPATASEAKNQKDDVPVFKFEKNIHDFGTIAQGEKISYAFRFENIGNGDLVIRAAQGSCGCTIPEYPKDVIKPGNGGVISVTFNSEGKEGHQEKTITIISNTIPNTYVLTITGEVKTVKQ